MRTDKPKRIGVIWAPQAKADLRSIDRDTALGILHCLDRYLRSGEGDIQKLKPPEKYCRLRCGNYRLFFDFVNAEAIRIIRVRHRREAYR